MLGATNPGLRLRIWVEELLSQGGERKRRAERRQNLGTCCTGSELGLTLSLPPCSTAELRVFQFQSQQSESWKQGRELRSVENDFVRLSF